MSIRVIQNPRLREELTRDMSVLAKQMARFLTKEMKRLTPKRTGETAESIDVVRVNRIPEGVVAYVNANRVFGWLEGGTKAHWVRPVRAKALAWVDTGGRRPGVVAGTMTGDFNMAFSKGHQVSGIRPLQIFARAVKTLARYERRVRGRA